MLPSSFLKEKGIDLRETITRDCAMSSSNKNTQLQDVFSALRTLLVGSVNERGVRPIVRKRVDGSDSIGGYPPE